MSLDVHPSFMPYASLLVAWLKARDPNFTVTSSTRSAAVQDRLRADYLSGKSPIYAAPTGCSKHQLGLAVDIARYGKNDPRLFSDPYLLALGKIWASVGGEWGGPRDPIHFGLPGKICD